MWRKASRKRNNAWEDMHQVLVVPFPIVQVPAHQFGRVVEERLLFIGFKSRGLPSRIVLTFGVWGLDPGIKAKRLGAQEPDLA